MVKKIKEIAIIGSGFGMLCVLDRLIYRNIQDSIISIYSKDHNEIGEAYKRAPYFFLMNTKTSALNLFDHVLNFSQWLQLQNQTIVGDKDYLPRNIYGKYLLEIKNILLSELKLRGNTIYKFGPIDFIDRAGCIWLKNGLVHTSNMIFLSMGYGDELNIEEIIQNIEKIPPNDCITVGGSGLTSIDIILLIAHLRPDLKINCYSLSGRFPSIRSNFEPGGPSFIRDLIQDNKTPSLHEALSRLKQKCNNKEDLDTFEGRMSPKEELDYACNQVSGWQKALYDATRDYADFFYNLPVSDKRILQKHKSEFIRRRVMYPIVNAKKITNLMEQGTLTINQRLFKAEPGTVGFLKAYNDPYALKKFTHKSSFKKNNFGEIVSNVNGCVCAKRSIYALGTLTNGTRFFTEASSLTKHHASLAADEALLNYKKINQEVYLLWPNLLNSPKI